MSKKHDNPRWEAVRAERDRLMSEEHEDYPVLAAYSDAWRMLSDDYESCGVARNREWESADEPFAAIMFDLKLGIYPPPELMLWMVGAWGEYINAGGAKTLEDVFLGKPVPGIGNYAARKNDRLMEMSDRFNFLRLMADGLSPERAAEVIIEARQIKVNGRLIEPSSLLRRFRKQSWYKDRKTYVAGMRHYREQQKRKTNGADFPEN